MKALAIDGPGVARVVERPRPAPGPGEVLLGVAYAGLCGTDLSAFQGKNPLVTYPRVIGHEISGRVIERGPGVEDDWLGADVAVSPYKNCGTCAACRLHRPNACHSNETLGVQRDGALSEFAAVPVARLVRSRVLPLDVLALVEPFSIGMHAVRRTEVAPGDTVLVMGCGGVGAGAIAAAAAAGATVIGLDLDSQKLAQAMVFGATHVIDGTTRDVAGQVGALTGGEGPSVVIEAVGTAATYRQALELVAACGRIGCLGWVKGDVPLEARLIVLKEVAILGSRNATDELAAVAALFESGRVDPRMLVTHRVAIDDAPAMLARWAAMPREVGKILVSVSGL